MGKDGAHPSRMPILHDCVKPQQRHIPACADRGMWWRRARAYRFGCRIASIGSRLWSILSDCRRNVDGTWLLGKQIFPENCQLLRLVATFVKWTLLSHPFLSPCPAKVCSSKQASEERLWPSGIKKYIIVAICLKMPIQWPTRNHMLLTVLPWKMLLSPAVSLQLLGSLLGFVLWTSWLDTLVSLALWHLGCVFWAYDHPNVQFNEWNSMMGNQMSNSMMGNDGCKGIKILELPTN